MRRYARLKLGLAIGAVLLVLALVIWPTVGYARWLALPEQPLDLLVYDLTVPDDSFREHRALGLVMEHLKVPFSVETGYFGSAPGGREQVGAWPTAVPDLILLVDAYGVYENQAGEVDADEGTDRRTGRLTAAQAADVVRWAAAGSVVWGETNVLGQPTEPEAATTLGELFGVETTGWMGKAFVDLGEVSRVLRSLHPGPWHFTGPGLILVSGTAAGGGRAELIVLTPDDLVGLRPLGRGTLPAGGGDYVTPIDGWFELVRAQPGATVEGTFELPLAESSRTRVGPRGLDQEWPLVVRRAGTVYVAANLSSTPATFPSRKVAGAIDLMRRVPHSAEAAAFYRLYAPLLADTVEQTMHGNGR